MANRRGRKEERRGCDVFKITLALLSLQPYTSPSSHSAPSINPSAASMSLSTSRTLQAPKVLKGWHTGLHSLHTPFWRCPSSGMIPSFNRSDFDNGLWSKCRSLTYTTTTSAKTGPDIGGTKGSAESISVTATLFRESRPILMLAQEVGKP